MLKIPAGDVEPAPAVLQEGGLNCVTGLGKFGGRLIVLLDMNKLLEHSAVRQRNAAGEAKNIGTGKAEVRGAGVK